MAGKPRSEESPEFAALAKGPSTGEGSRRNNPFGVSQVAKGPPEQAWAGEEVPHVPLGKAWCPAGRHPWSDGAWGCWHRLGPGLALPHKHLWLPFMFTLYPDALCGSLCLVTTSKVLLGPQGPVGRRGDRDHRGEGLGA